MYWAGWTGIVFADPVRRALARLVQAIPIDPQRGAASSLALGGAVLKRGMGLVWFPEGRRSEDGKLQPFMPGLGMLLEHFSVPVRGSGHHSWRIRGVATKPTAAAAQAITVQILPLVDTAHLEREGRGDKPSQRIVDALHAHLARSIEQAGSVAR